jgi:hypothetical protein
MEKMMEDFIAAQNKTNNDMATSIRDLNTKFDLLATQNKMIENQIAQQGSAPRGMFPGKPEVNPKEQVQQITLRSGTSYEGPAMPTDEDPKVDTAPAKQQPITAPVKQQPKAQEKEQPSENVKDKSEPAASGVSPQVK